MSIRVPAETHCLDGVMRAIAAPPVSRPAADLLLILLASLAVFALAAFTQLSERLVSLSRAHERLQIDELPLALLTFSLGLAWFAWRRWRETGMALRHRLAIEQALADNQAELREFSRRITDAQERERRLLAHELHDELGQSLNAIKIEAVTIRNGSREALPAVHDSALSVIRLTDRVYEVVRDMTSRLRPVALDELGLVGALEHALAGWRSLAPGTEFLDSFRDVPASLDESTAIALYRVVQESVTNMLRHSGATQMSIVLEAGLPRSLRLVIRDNGQGADLAAVRRGLGLRGMRERIEGLGGSFAIVSQPGAGFVVDVTVPLHCLPVAGGRP